MRQRKSQSLELCQQGEQQLLLAASQLALADASSPRYCPQVEAAVKAAAQSADRVSALEAELAEAKKQARAAQVVQHCQRAPW